MKYYLDSQRKEKIGEVMILLDDMVDKNLIPNLNLYVGSSLRPKELCLAGGCGGPRVSTWLRY